MNLTGQSIGRYHISEKLGEGGMATVYRARDTRLDRDVAIKFIRTDLFPPAILQTVLQRFEREAKALARLDHPNIVHVHDYGEYENAPYLVMEYLPGGTLRQRMGKPLPYQEAVALLAPIANALEYAHGENIIHRDVKPVNILFNSKGVPKLSDFGIAKLLGGDETTTLTGTGMGMGTPAYMAPEQWSGITSPAVDQYAMGVILYELLTGHLPFQADTPAKLLVQVLTQPLPDARRYVSDLPESSLDVLKKALGKTPEERYSDMETFSTALLDLSTSSSMPQPEAEQTQYQPTAEIPTRVAQPPSLSQSQDGRIAKVPQRTASQRRRFPWWAWLAGGAVLVGIIALGVIQVTGGGGIRISGVATSTSTETLQFRASDTMTPRQQDTPMPTPTLTLTGPPTQTVEPTVTSTPTPTSTSTPTHTPIPTLGIGSTRKAEKDGMLQAYIPAGSFQMGTTSGGWLEDPVHSVTLDAFWMDMHEVNNAQYALCVADGGCQLPVKDSSFTRDQYYGNSEFDNYPVIYISWFDALAYCTWAGRSLPTEAEWEYAARGDDGRTYPWGNSFVGVNVNFCDRNCPFGYADMTNDDGYGDTAPVGMYPNGASPFGVLNMAGNVWEWVSSLFLRYPYDAKDGRESYNIGSINTNRVYRGGSWSSGVRTLYSAHRGGFDIDASASDINIGFRCASSP